MLNDSNDSDLPDPRSSSSLVTIANGLFLLFGGANRQLCFKDIWSLHISNTNEGPLRRWQKIDYSSQISPRFGTVAFYNKEKRELLIHGGQNFFVNEIYGDFIRASLEINEPDQNKKSKISLI